MSHRSSGGITEKRFTLDMAMISGKDKGGYEPLVPTGETARACPRLPF